MTPQPVVGFLCIETGALARNDHNLHSLIPQPMAVGFLYQALIASFRARAS